MVKVPDFDALYESDPDPFHVRSSFYEQRKIGLVLDCLTKPSVSYTHLTLPTTPYV